MGLTLELTAVPCSILTASPNGFVPVSLKDLLYLLVSTD